MQILTAAPNQVIVHFNYITLQSGRPPLPTEKIVLQFKQQHNSQQSGLSRDKTVLPNTPSHWIHYNKQ
jgi:hypothetical protein